MEKKTLLKTFRMTKLTYSVPDQNHFNNSGLTHSLETTQMPQLLHNQSYRKNTRIETP